MTTDTLTRTRHASEGQPTGLIVARPSLDFAEVIALASGIASAFSLANGRAFTATEVAKWGSDAFTGYRVRLACDRDLPATVRFPRKGPDSSIIADAAQPDSRTLEVLVIDDPRGD